MPRLVLASGSPRRQEILARLGYRFTVRPADVDESREAGESARAYVRRLSGEKAHAESHPGEVILAADTIVVLGDELLGKPRDAEDAAAMLGRLSGREHEVSTGVAVLDVDSRRLEAVVETTTVSFNTLSPSEIDWYVSGGEPMDKAGAYAIQGLASVFIEKIAGSYTNVVGLPTAPVYRLLAARGLRPAAAP